MPRPIVYAELRIQIHGIETDKDSLLWLSGWVHEAVKAGLLGNMKEHFNFRNNFDDDIEVELETFAGGN